MFKSSVNVQAWLYRWVAPLLVAVICGACGDPGTGGSGVPTATTGTGSNTSNAPVTGTGATNQPAPTTDTAPAPAQGTGGLINTPLSASQASTYGIIEVPPAGNTSGIPSGEISVKGIRFDSRSAMLIGSDGLSRTAERLLPGVPVLFIYSASADLAAAAAGASGAAVPLERVILTDPSAGQLISEPAGSRVLLDNGSSVPLSMQAVVIGSAGPGNRVRVWVFAEGNNAQVSRLEFE